MNINTPTEPLVTVIIPTYNRAQLIVSALNSIFAQTYQNYEILVMDDASTDNTEEVIRELHSEKIRYYKLGKNGGQCIARNAGIKLAQGNFIAFLDSDDEWLPEKLEKQVDCFRRGSDKLGAVYGYAYQKDVIKNETTLVTTDFYRGDIYHKFLEGFCPATPSLFMVKKEALLKVNGFDEDLITFVDLSLWLKISKDYHFDFVEEPLIIKYEQIGDQYVNNFEKRYNGFRLFMNKWQEEIVKNIGAEGLSKIKKRLTYAIVVPILDHPPKTLRKNIFKLIGLLLDIKSTNFRFYTKALLIYIFGPNIIYFIRRKIK